MMLFKKGFILRMFNKWDKFLKMGCVFSLGIYIVMYSDCGG